MNLFVALTAVAAFGQAPSIDRYTQPIKDITFSMDVKTGNQPELRKISKDFGEAYRFAHVDFKIKESFEIRGDTKVDDTSIVMILADGIRVFRAPRQNINVKKDVRKNPGQRQTIFEFGILTPELFDSFMTSKFVRNDRATGDVVFDLAFHEKFGDTTRYRVWIDGEKKFTSKKEWYGQDGTLKATFTFSDPEKVGSMWLPTIASVKNAEGKVAGVLRYSKFKINAGISDSIFKY
jgi:outer membrane lipoprotein-sorting protein